MDDSSPYEPVAANRQPDTFRLASISSGTAALTFTGRGHLFLERLIPTVRGCEEPPSWFLSSIPTVDDRHAGTFDWKRRCGGNLRGILGSSCFSVIECLRPTSSQVYQPDR